MCTRMPELYAARPQVIAETPAACMDIDAVMEAHHDLVEVADTLKQVFCVKG